MAFLFAKMSKYLEKISEIDLKIKKFETNITNLISVQEEYGIINNELKDIYKKIQLKNAIENNIRIESEANKNINDRKIDELNKAKEEKVLELNKTIESNRLKSKRQYKNDAEEVLKEIIKLECDVKNKSAVEQLEIKCLSILKEERDFDKKCAVNEDNFELREKINKIITNYNSEIENIKNEITKNPAIENNISVSDEESHKKIDLLENDLKILREQMAAIKNEINNCIIRDDDINLDDVEIDLIANRQENINDKIPKVFLGFVNKTRRDFDKNIYNYINSFYCDPDIPIFILFEDFERGDDEVSKTLYKICENIIIDSISKTYFDSIKYYFLDKNIVEGNVRSYMHNIGKDLDQYKKYEIIEFYRQGGKTIDMFEEYMIHREKEIDDTSIENKNNKLKKEGSSKLIKNNILFARFYEENDCDYKLLKNILNKCKFYGVFPICFLNINILQSKRNELKEILDTYTDGNYLRLDINSNKNLLTINNFKI